MYIDDAKNRILVFDKLLKSYQREFLAASENHEKFGCCITIGGGKTFSALNWVNRLFAENKITKAIVLCPASKVSDWKTDLSGKLGQKLNQFPAFQTVVVKSAKELPLLFSEPDGTIFVVSLGLFQQSSMRDFIYNNSGKLRSFAYIFDESSKLKNARSVVSQNILLLNYLVKYGLLLSGSLMSNGYVDLFMQCFVLGVNFNLYDSTPPVYTNMRDYYSQYWKQWHLFEDNFLEYDERTIYLRNNAGSVREQVVKEIVGYKNEDVILQKLKAHIYLVDEKYVQQVDDDRFVTKKDDYTVYEDVVYIEYVDTFGAGSYYGDLHKFLNHYKGIPDFGLDLSRICRQWANGYMTFNENHQRLFNLNFSKVKSPNLPKIDYLREYLTERNFINAIVFYNFKEELADLKRLAAELNYEVLEINGENKFKGAERHEKQLILAQYAAGAIGLNLQHLANHLIFYSPTTSCEQYLQAKGRIDRTGQTEDCYIVDLILADSVEEKIFHNLMNRSDYIETTFNLKKELASVARLREELEAANKKHTV